MSTKVHEYTPRGSFVSMIENRDPEVLAAGPAGTGKSRACLEKLNLLALMHPGMKGLIVRKTLASLGTTALDTWRKFVVPEALSTGEVTYYGGSQQEAPQYRYRNGSRIFIGGMDKAMKIMSSEYDVVYVQEATELTDDDWQAILTRLRNGVIPFQQIVADCNPDTPFHWLKMRCDAGRTTMLNTRHEDNPILFNADGSMTPRGTSYMAKLDSLTGVRHKRLRKGLWVAADGQVYEEWDQHTHLVDSFEIPKSWRRWWGVDFGYKNPFVCQWWAEDEKGVLYLYREIYMTRRTVDVHARQILQIHKDSGEPAPFAIVCDHDAENRATLEKGLGMGTTAAHKSVLDGIQQVEMRLKDRSLFIFRDALVEKDQNLVDTKRPTCTAEEIPSYVWKPAPTGGVLQGTVVKEEPLKKDDHGCDTMRYVVAEVDLGVRPRLRWMK